MKKPADDYLKIVECSDEDGCYVGRCPDLMLGGVHGMDERKVFEELCLAVEEWVVLLKNDKLPMPKAALKRSYSGKLLLRIPPDIHKKLAVQAEIKGLSLNHLCRELLAARA